MARNAALRDYQPTHEDLGSNADDEVPIEKDQDDARQGVELGVMRYVLGISLILVVIAFATVSISGWMTLR